jgi:hypothetical protein
MPSSDIKIGQIDNRQPFVCSERDTNIDRGVSVISKKPQWSRGAFFEFVCSFRVLFLSNVWVRRGCMGFDMNKCVSNSEM